MSGLDHTSLSVSDFTAAKAFYIAALEPLGITVLMEFPKAVTGNVDVAGLGSNGKPFFWLAGAGKTSPRIHIAFVADSRAEVDAFYKAAIAAGGKACGRCTTPTTTARSCSMLMATTSRPCAMRRSR